MLTVLPRVPAAQLSSSHPSLTWHTDRGGDAEPDSDATIMPVKLPITASINKIELMKPAGRLIPTLITVANNLNISISSNPVTAMFPSNVPFTVS